MPASHRNIATSFVAAALIAALLAPSVAAGAPAKPAPAKPTPAPQPTKPQPAPAAPGAPGAPVSPSQSLPQPPADPKKHADFYQRLCDSLRARLRTQALKLRLAQDQTAAAQKSFDVQAEQVRAESKPDEVARRATQAVSEARKEVDEQARKALRPLKEDWQHQQKIAQRGTLEVRRDALMDARAKAEQQRLPFPADQQVEIVRLSVEYLDVNRQVEDREEDALEKHAGYQEAIKAYEAAVNEATDAIKGAELRRPQFRLQSALKDLQSSLAAESAARREIVGVQRQLAEAAAALANAQTPKKR